MSYEQKTWGRCFNIAKNFLHILGLLEAFYTRNSRQSPAHTMLQLPSGTQMAESNRARRKGGGLQCISMRIPFTSFHRHTFL